MRTFRHALHDLALPSTVLAVAVAGCASDATPLLGDASRTETKASAGGNASSGSGTTEGGAGAAGSGGIVAGGMAGSTACGAAAGAATCPATFDVVGTPCTILGRTCTYAKSLELACLDTGDCRLAWGFPNPPTCPPKQPRMADACAAEGAVCRYPAYGGCITVATCTNGVWHPVFQDVSGGCDLGPACPIGEPTFGQACPHGFVDAARDCRYAHDGCFTYWDCEMPAGFHTAAMRPPDSCCASTAPAIASTCTHEGVTCTYAAGAVTCTNGAWAITNVGAGP